MFTPASAYFIEGDSLSYYPGADSRPSCTLRNELQPAAAGSRRIPKTDCAQTTYLVRGSNSSDKTSGSKCPEQALPSHSTRMDNGIRIRIKSFANLAWLPGILPDVQRHVNHHRRSDNVISRNTAPEAAVVGIAAIIANCKITFVRNGE